MFISLYCKNNKHTYDDEKRMTGKRCIVNGNFW